MLIFFKCGVRVFLFTAIFLIACSPSKNDPSNGALFDLLPSSQTNVKFSNTVTDSKEMSILNYHNFYNGGGVAIGDIDNDGKPDIFFTSNQGENKLYRNKGNFQFEDITTLAKISSTHKWHTGVTMVDINGDGWLDIYVCNAGIINGDDRSNELYINQKNGTFLEQAQEYGLDDKGASTQAIFFDYDHDGDLDCFIINNSPRSIDNFGYKKNAREVRDPINGDRLYRNDHGKFIDVTASSGIYSPEIAFGLGVTVGDVNNDGWEDIYVANDFFERDYLYINQHDGTFKESISSSMGHISNGAMGTDLSDINNDGYLDLFTSEMLPENDYRLKTTIKFDIYDVQNAKNQLDFHHQFTGNTLQLNNQDGTFSEIAQLAGVDATGWSWGVLSFDFDNDGNKDLFVCNGILKDLTNQDFLAYFNSQEVMSKVMQGGYDFMDFLKKMPSTPIANFAFVNQKNLIFKNQAAELGFGKLGFSSGAAYADLDGDGDLDLVINNQNEEASIYRNLSTEKLKHHFLKIKLKGKSPNNFGLGARATIYTGNTQQVLEQMPTRGFQSSVNPELLFGLNDHKVIDSLVLQWPDQKQQTIRNIKADTVLVLNQEDAKDTRTIPKAASHLYKDITTAVISGNIKHKEDEYVDFNVERLMPKLLSTEGPKLAVADVNGDGLEDFFVGGAKGDTCKLFLQNANGHFVQSKQIAFNADAYFESIGAEFFDADGDGDMDLIVASGGNEVKEGSPYLFTRLYINDGKGNFSSSKSKWPAISINAACVRVIDFNKDGKPDIFIGARNIPGSYGLPASSVLLQNDGGGNFTDVTNKIAPDLEKLGMVTDAQWADLDGDGEKELIVAGDWMPISFFKFSKNTFHKTGEIPHSSGWWNCIKIADLNGDGKLDIVGGNFGLNSSIKADQNHPAKLYISDFDKNGQSECIPVYFKTDGKAYPYYLKDELEQQIPSLKKTLLHYDDYAGKPIEKLFTKEQLEAATVLTVEQTHSTLFLNQGKGNFTAKELPVMAQITPMFGIEVMDINGDGKNDLFLGGNFYGLKPQTGRLDAGYGTSLINNGKGDFTYVEVKETGLFINGETRDMAIVKTAKGKTTLIVSMNNEKLYLFEKNK